MNWTNTASTGCYRTDWQYENIKKDKKEIETELKKIAKEQKEDKEKHLPIFDPKDLDI